MKELLYGAAYYDEYMPYDRLDKDVEMMKKAGINTVRIAESTWSTCEPQPGVFDFSHVERVMDAMEEAGINVIIGTPTYAVPTWMVKAHPDVLNSLLQILDDGRLTDAQGRVVSFENTVIVMTSNAGSQSNNTPAGFGRTVSQMSKDRVMKALEEIMRPEFLNRIDEIIAFNQLSEDNFRHIAEIMLGELRTTLADKDIRLTWDDSLLGLLTEKSYSVKYGARNLRRLIEKEIENPLATAIVTGDKPLMGAHLSAVEGKVKLDTI